MMTDGSNSNQSGTEKGNTADLEMEQLLGKRSRIDSLLQKKFRKYITVMFTDMKGSTSLADTKGDITVRLIINEHLKIILPIIEKYNGKHVKTMGDGTLSYFENAQDAVHAAVNIQKSIEEYNRTEEPKIPIRLRIGLHTGNCLIDGNDIIGDVVNVTSRFESIADPGTIFFSEETYKNLSDENDIYCRFIKTTMLKGKKDTFKVFEALWDKKRIEEDRSCPWLEIQWKDHTSKIIHINKKETLLGRSKKCDIIIDDQYISRQHARIFFEKGHCFIEDLKSHCGVVVNGKKVIRHQLKNGDKITFRLINITYIEPSLKI